jgi:dinuclear metal center YbgI/SA1388 family protein
MQTVAKIIGFLDDFAPTELAASWDNVGLLLGDRNTKVKRAVTCLTLTSAVASEAVEEKAQLIITHHPILFRAVKRLTADNSEGRMLLSLARHGIAVYSPHTAFDNTPGGINDSIALKMGLLEAGPLRKREAGRQVKLVVFVPDKDLTAVSEALFTAGAGQIGQYRECSFRLAGTGTFHGSETSHPTVGQKGRREEVSEWRLEVVCPEAAVERVLSALRKAHSYEEPAFDVYPLRPAWSPLGEGRVGKLPRPTALVEVAQALKSALAVEMLPIVGDEQQKIQKVAIACGAGGEMLSDVFRSRADLFVTGELRFHDYLAAQAHDVALCLPGHYATERFGVEELAVRLQDKFKDVVVWPSRRERDPISTV